MELSERRLRRIVSETRFDPKPLEKGIRLLDFLADIEKHPDLRGSFALKGGTALNLFQSDIPRLSVDIDINYIQSAKKKTMMSQRDKLEDEIEKLGEKKGYQLDKKSESYALSSFHFSYHRASGGRDSLKVEVNFLMRQPLYNISSLRPRELGSMNFPKFPVLNIHDLLAGKLKGLFEREAARDLYDASTFLGQEQFQLDKLKLAFLVYGASSRVDWREISSDDINYELEDVENNLYPMLGQKERESIDDIGEWFEEKKQKVRRAVEPLLEYTENQRVFLEEINEKGTVKPKLLTNDVKLQKRISGNPALQWKTKNVRDHFDIPEAGQ